MLQKMTLDGKDMFGFEAKGNITAEDYQTHLLPLFDKARSEGKRIRFLFYLGPEFSGFTAGAGWEDFKLGMHYLRTLERCAIVSDVQWVQLTSRFFGSLIPCPTRVFKNSALQEAKLWLNSGEIGLDHHLDEKTGVLKVEITAPLTSENFAILTNTVDTWLEKEGKLNGLVIHAKKFPGWEDVGSFISHITFVKNHHQKIRRIALCADGLMPTIGPQLANHFVEAKIEHFPYDQLKKAIDWASKG